MLLHFAKLIINKGCDIIKKSKENKTRTTLYIENDLLLIAEREIDNFSATVNFLLRNYLHGNSVEILDMEINEHKEKIKTLELKKQILKKANIAENEFEKLKINSFNELKVKYDKYVKFQGFNRLLAVNWLKGPNNKKYLKILDKTPEETLELLQGV